MQWLGPAAFRAEGFELSLPPDDGSRRRSVAGCHPFLCSDGHLLERSGSLADTRREVRAMPKDTLTITDNRTGKQYEIAIELGAI